MASALSSFVTMPMGSKIAQASPSGRAVAAVTAPASVFPRRRSAFKGASLKQSFARASRQQPVACRAECGKPLVGNPAPDFAATAVFDQEFMDITLSQYKGKYVVLFFYPLDFTFVCPTEITAFSDKHDEFAAVNCEILGVSVDSQFAHLAWIQTDRKEGGVGDLKYPLVADLKREIVTAYNVLSDEGVALRALFIIDKEGVIQHSTINNLAFGRNVEETLRILQAIQYVQENPDEVCPAGWKPGDKTMKPDPTGSKEYFAAI